MGQEAVVYTKGRGIIWYSCLTSLGWRTWCKFLPDGAELHRVTRLHVDMIDWSVNVVCVWKSAQRVPLSKPVSKTETDVVVRAIKFDDCDDGVQSVKLDVAGSVSKPQVRHCMAYKQRAKHSFLTHRIYHWTCSETNWRYFCSMRQTKLITFDSNA